MQNDNTFNPIQLGCLSLILIAIIVSIFTGMRSAPDAAQLEDINAKLTRLEQKIDRLERRLSENQPPARPGASSEPSESDQPASAAPQPVTPSDGGEEPVLEF